MAEDEYGRTVWQFRPADKIAGRARIPLEVSGDGWNGDSPFREYTTPEPLKAVIWGGKADLSLVIALSGAAEEGAAPAISRRRDRRLSPQLQARVKELNAKIRELRVRLPKPPDAALQRRYLEYVDSLRLKEAFQKLLGIWSDPERDMTWKCREAGECLVELHDILTPMRLPAELLRDDTTFVLVLARVLKLAQTVEESAGRQGTDLPVKVHELVVFLDVLTDRMIEGGNALYGLERSMTPEEMEAVQTLETVAMCSDTPDEERLDLLRQLWENPLIVPNDRISYLEEAVELTRKQGRKGPGPVPCPDKALIERHLGEIGRCLRGLEAEGAEAWRSRMAAGLMDTAAAWRAGTGLPALSHEAFASGIHLRSVILETEDQKDGKIHARLQLFFEDKSDSFAGHMLYASVTNGEVGEITLTG